MGRDSLDIPEAGAWPPSPQPLSSYTQGLRPDSMPLVRGNASTHPIFGKNSGPHLAHIPCKTRDYS